MPWKWLPMVANLVGQIPFEKLIRPPDRRNDLNELREILKASRPEKAATPEPVAVPASPLEGESPKLQPRVATASSHSDTSVSIVSIKETIDYQKREMGKDLLALERHAVQKFRISGRVCDCGQSRHFLGLEKLAEEAISMDSEPALYYRVLDWVRATAPKCTVEAVTSGKYDAEYPHISTDARDLRKALLGTLDTDALWPEQSGEELHPKESPVATLETSQSTTVSESKQLFPTMMVDEA